jgi:hypothetical protein
MNTIQLLEKQFKANLAQFHELVDDVTEAEWLSRPGAKQNLFAFTAWHVPRTQDNFIHTWVRNVPELITAPRWQVWHGFKTDSAGIGIPLARADEIAWQLKKPDVLEYADLVCGQALAWMQTLSDAELDRVPEYSAHLAAFPEYQTPGYKADTDHLLDKPLWRILSGTCLLHLRGHLGELELAKSLARKD